MRHDDAAQTPASGGAELLEHRLLEDGRIIDGAAADDDKFALSLPFNKTTTASAVSDTSPDADESARLALLLHSDRAEVSAEIAEQERVDRSTPPIYLPGNKQRQSRSILTIVVSIVAALALVGVGVVFAVKSQAATPEEAAFDAYATRQLAVAQANRELSATFDAIVTAKAEAETVNIVAAASLATVAGVADEVARAAAENQRISTTTSIAAITVTDPADTPYVVPEVSTESTLTEIAAGLDELSSEATRIEDSQTDLDAALLAVTEARDDFAAAFTAFVDTVPATALSITAANQDADQQWRDAVTTAVAALVSAAEKGAGAPELQAYAAAAFALQDENARVVREQETGQDEQEQEEQEEDTPRRAPIRPRGDSVPDTAPRSDEAEQSPVTPKPEAPPTVAPPQVEEPGPGESDEGAPA
ncbi:hypothetical protein [Mycetocola zhujimingii]|uniref:Uncharacterized protein n=1 Tax=Mycetocola zhujimingii TaxID=2079792 RepID=A0A2U1TFB5_9MICO|nr:hypothetical protein [Mycetocola zhujimingii]PWC07595.1 hypothetical protein DF223_06060 [Mycetocola zhujimingii]